MSRTSLLCASLLLCVACGSQAAEPTAQSQSTANAKPPALPELRAPLTELGTWFDSHRSEPRFIAILSPT